MSTEDLEDFTPLRLADLLVREGLLSFVYDEHRYVTASKYIDPSGNEMWWLNIILSIGKVRLVEDNVPLGGHSYLDMDDAYAARAMRRWGARDRLMERQHPAGPQAGPLNRFPTLRQYCQTHVVPWKPSEKGAIP